MVTEWAAAHGLWVAEVVTEVGSGMKGSGRELGRLPSDATATRRGREPDPLARLSLDHMEAALSAQGRRILVVDDGEMDDDLVRDVTDVLTSFCARL